jgi:hypothetical protein
VYKLGQKNALGAKASGAFALGKGLFSDLEIVRCESDLLWTNDDTPCLPPANFADDKPLISTLILLHHERQIIECAFWNEVHEANAHVVRLVAFALLDVAAIVR